jgi:hypothetical protein
MKTNDSAIFTAFDDHKQVDFSEPEKNLMRSVLSTALDDVCKGGDRARDALRFFASRDDDYLFSFLNICYHLDLCAITVQKLAGIAAVSNRPDEPKKE